MKNLFNPKWLLLVNTLPIIVLLFVFYSEFQVIKTLLKPQNIAYWHIFSAALLLLGILNFGYTLYLVISKQNVSFYYAIITSLTYIPYIYLYIFNIEKILPSNIPQWMLSDNIILYVGTFLMPTLAYSFFILIIRFTSTDEEHPVWKNFVISAIIPISWFVFFQVIVPSWKPFENEFSIHVFLISLFIGTLIFLFFLVRGFYIILTNKPEFWEQNQFVLKITFSLVLPIIGLLVNNRVLGISSRGGIFGNFTDNWFYILTFINALFLSIPNFLNTRYRFILFIGRCILFAYTFYFFIIFLPFLPLSIIALIFFGTGFLILTPLLLFVLHVVELSNDYNYLKSFFTKKIIIPSAFVAFLLIPAVVTFTFWRDKNTLNQALDYIYNPDYTQSYKIDKMSLKRTISNIKYQKYSRNGIFGVQLPYLSTYFKWIVLDNLTLSDTKINSLENIFFGTPLLKVNTVISQSDKVEITAISSKSTFDHSQNAWKSWIDLEITNKSNEDAFAEYMTTFELPKGTWISDYYLYIGNKKEMGILAEKKTAMWIFDNIRNQNRDPGILHYLTGNKIAFKVFPFSKNETRKTGFELLHREPTLFSIDGKNVKLGDEDEVATIYENNNAIYIPVAKKQNLKKVKRMPYLHFIVNTSKEENRVKFILRIQRFIASQGNIMDDAKISYVNTYVSTTELMNNWKTRIQNQTFGGGFFVDRAIKSILFQSVQNQSTKYPIFIVVTDKLENAFFENDFSDWTFCFPENHIFFNLIDNGVLEAHDLMTKPQIKTNGTVNLSEHKEVFEYRLKNNSIRYLADDNQPSIILKTPNFENSKSAIKEKNWETALNLEAKQIAFTLYPNIAEKEWINVIKESFLSKVMTPATSYLVVENDAQKTILKKKQKRVLAGKKALDLAEDTRQMSEPNTIILLISICSLLYIRHYKKTLKTYT